MTALFFSILCSTLIFVIFRLFDRFKINVFHAVIINYFTAFIIGIALFYGEWNEEAATQTEWLKYVFLVSIMLIGLFVVMGKSTQSNGLASTSIAVKMSMAVSLVLLIIFYHESLSFFKIIGILFAVSGVFLVSYKPSGGERIKASWMLPFLFAGSGLLDFTLNFVQNEVLSNLTPSLFTAFSFAAAGVIGLIVLSIGMLRQKPLFEVKNILAGIVLGVPNFFSIYLLLMSYRTTGWKDSTVLAITNVSIVLLSALIGFFLFRERVTSLKLMGLLVAVAAIITLYFAN